MVDLDGSNITSLWSSRHKPVDDEELGLQVDNTTVAGGGHHARHAVAKKSALRVSHALRAFLARENVIPAADARLGESEDTATTGALRHLIVQPHVLVPQELTDRSHPLPEYFISSSHNTYLMAHQLFGTSSAQAYERALGAGARCVEIDAWDDDAHPDEPKVTHGYTLVSNIPFRAVCETVRDVVDREAAAPHPSAPVVLSLENHCSAHGQLRLVQIMREVWGDRLLSAAVREKGHQEQTGGDHVTLEELGSKIVVIVEYHFPNEAEDDTDESSSEEDDGERQARLEYKRKKKAAPVTVIVPELADLGVYAQSVKPVDNSWYESPRLVNGPHHHLINVSESGLASIMPAANGKIGRHNAHHLMRVYPMGTRISSRNLHPVPFWAVGAQICAINWQSFDANMQLNEALFSGTDGYVLKPPALRAGGSGSVSAPGRQKRLRMRVAGATDVPLPAEREMQSFRPYVTCDLVHPDLPEPVKRKTKPYHYHRLGFLRQGDNPPATDPFWDETLEWVYQENDMVFLRILVKDDVSFARNPKVAVMAVKLSYIVGGWRFIDMLDLRGGETTCSLLVNFESEDA